MLTCREAETRLTVNYRPGVFGIVGGALVVLGIVLALVGARLAHDVTLTCVDAKCSLERVAITGSERQDVVGLHGTALAQELVLRANPDVVMGPWVARRGAASYRAAQKTIDEYIAKGLRGQMSVTVPVRSTLRWLGFGAVAFVLGLGLSLVFAIGARTLFDRRDGTVQRLGSRRRAKLSDITAVEVRKNQIIAKLKDGGEVALVSALGKPPDLEPVAVRIRAFVLS